MSPLPAADGAAPGIPDPRVSQPRHVLHVCAGNQFGGVESMLVNLARGHSIDRQLRHTFASCFDSRFSRELLQTGAPLHRLPAVRLSRPWEILRARTALRRVLTASPPVIVVTHSAWTRLVFGRSLLHAGTPTVAWIHGAGSPLSRMDRWGQRPTPSLVILNSHHTGDLVQNLFSGTPRAVVYCPVSRPPTVSPQARQTLRESLGADPCQTVILMAARLEPWKGHELLLQGLSRIAASTPWTCWIAGGPQTAEQRLHRDTLIQGAKRLGIAGRIVFLGERNDVPQLMGAADLYCQPNLGPEPFGVVFIEALYAGLPVVTTGQGGALEIIRDDCGRLVPLADANALSQALGSLIADPGLRARLGARGPARAAELCDPAERIRQLDECLSQLLPGSPTERSAL